MIVNICYLMFGIITFCGLYVSAVASWSTNKPFQSANFNDSNTAVKTVKFRIAIFCSTRQRYPGILDTCYPKTSNFTILCDSFQFAANYANKNILVDQGMELELEIIDICSSDDRGYYKTVGELLKTPDICHQINLSHSVVRGNDSLLIGIAGTQSATLSKVQLSMFRKFCMPILPALSTTDEMWVYDNFVQTAPAISTTSKILIKLLSTYQLTLVTVIYDTDDQGTGMLQQFQDDLNAPEQNENDICVEATIPIISSGSSSDQNWDVVLSTIDAGKSRVLILLLGQDSAYEMIEQITEKKPKWVGNYQIIFGSVLTVLRMEEHKRRRRRDILDNSLAVESYIRDSLNYTEYLETVQLNDSGMLAPLIVDRYCRLNTTACYGNETLGPVPNAIIRSATFCISTMTRVAYALKAMRERNCGENQTGVCPEFWTNRYKGFRGDHFTYKLKTCYGNPFMTSLTDDDDDDFDLPVDDNWREDNLTAAGGDCTQPYYGIYQYRREPLNSSDFRFVKIADYQIATDSLELEMVPFDEYDTYMSFLAKNAQTVADCKYCQPYQTSSKLGQCCVQCKNCTTDYQHVQHNMCVDCPPGMVQHKDNNTCVESIFKISPYSDQRILIFVSLSYLGIALVFCVAVTIVIKHRSPAAQMSFTPFIMVMALTSMLDFGLCLLSARDLTAGECEAVWVFFSAGWTITAGSMIMKLYLYSHLTKFPPPIYRMDKASLVAMVVALTLTQFVLYQILLTISGAPEIDLVKSYGPGSEGSDPSGSSSSTAGYMQICSWFSPDLFIFLTFPSCLILVVILYALTLTKITIRYIHREIKFLLISGILMLAVVIILSPSISTVIFSANVSDRMLFFMTFCLFFGSIKLSCLLLPTTILIVFRPRRNTLDYISSQKIPKMSFKSGSVFKIHLERIGNSIVNELPLTRRKSSFIAQPNLEPIIERDSIETEF